MQYNQLISLDQIVKNILLKRRYSLHWYLDFLVPAKDCLREISFDLPINTLRYKVLTLNDNNAIEIPNDYQDWARVSVRIGQYLKPLVETNGLDLVPNYDSNFDIQPYNTGIATETDPSQTVYYSGYASPLWWTVNWNTFGENIGRQFGGVGSYPDTFTVNKARNEIKINEDYGFNEIVLEYIGSGVDADSATHIDPYCQNCIEAYCLWQFYLNNRTYSTSDEVVMEQRYIKERQILTARLSDITLDKLKRVVQRNSISIKY
jgi:hypothetical protein